MVFEIFKSKDKLSKLKSHIKSSFRKVKNDTATLFEWIQYLYDHLQKQQEEIEEIKERLDEQVLSKSDIKEVVDNHYKIQEIERLNETIQKLHNRTDILASLHDEHDSKLEEIHSHIENIGNTTEEKTSSLKNKLAKKITRNSKEYMKNTIVNYIQKYEEIPALELREMLVEEQDLCSKSSFYRLLRELEEEDKVSFVKDGRKKVYFAKKKATNNS